MFDCDGVLWSGTRVIDGAVALLAQLRRAGQQVYFVSNNSALSRQQYVAKLAAIGIESTIGDVFCSSYAAAEYLAQLGYAGKAYVIGLEGIGHELRLQANIEPVEARLLHREHVARAELDHVVLDPAIGAVIVGFDPELTYTKMSIATFLLNDRPHVHFVCTNRDATFPTATRLFPGGGSCVAAVEVGAQRAPIDVGKPSMFMMDLMKRRYEQTAGRPFDASRALMVGDNLATDIVFGARGGLRTALVLSGVTSIARLEHADNRIRPDFVFDSVRDLVAAAAAAARP